MLKAEYHYLSAKEAKKRIDSESNIVVLDVRTKEEFNAEHIPLALNIPLNIVCDKVQELYEKDTILFIYCRSGVRSKVATSQLALMGYNNVFDFGGIIDWPFEKVK